MKIIGSKDKPISEFGKITEKNNPKEIDEKYVAIPIPTKNANF